MEAVSEAACDTNVDITRSGSNVIQLPAIVDCGMYAYGRWFLTDEDEMVVKQSGELKFSGKLSSFFVDLEDTGIFKFIVMRVLIHPKTPPS